MVLKIDVNPKSTNSTTSPSSFSLRGAQVDDIFMCLIHTCKLAKVNPFHYLVALQRHAQTVFKNPQDWLPWNYTTVLAALSA